MVTFWLVEAMARVCHIFSPYTAELLTSNALANMSTI